MLLINILIFIGALVALILGSEYFVKSSASIAEKMGISEFVIGLTLVAIGTSVPELAASIIASLRGEAEIVVGNIVGSNIANIALIIGIAASIAAIKTEEKMLVRDGYIMMFATILFYAAMAFGAISRLTAGIFLILYLAYTIFLFESKHRDDDYHFRSFMRYFFRFRYIRTIHAYVLEEIRKAKNKEQVHLVALYKAGVVKDLGIVLLSGIAIYGGAKFLIQEAVFFAEFFNVAKSAIGVSMVAFGTSVPELSVVLTAAKKGYGNIAVGNIIGSNIANILLIGGVASMITPIRIDTMTLLFTAPFMIITSLMLLFFIKSEWQIHRTEGLAFIATYAIFLAILFYSVTHSF